MSTHDFKSRSSKQLLDALSTARESARLQLHLLSAEAKQRWQELESNVFDLQSKLEQGGDRIAESVSVTVRDLTHTVQDLFREAEALQLATPVRKLMSATPRVCSPEDSLSRAAQIMWEADCGAVPVVDDAGLLLGIVTDRDVCMASYTRGQSPSALSVESTMSKNVCAASPDDSLGQVARLMGEKQVHRVPIIEHGRLVGIVALADIARHVRSSDGNSLPACVVLAHTLGRISSDRADVGTRAAAE